MNLPKDVWYVRLFHTCLFLWASLRFNDEWERHHYIEVNTTRTNLCLFVRAIVVWAPLVIAVNLAAYAIVVGVLVAAPIYFFGGGGYLMAVGGLVLVVAVVIGLVALGQWYAANRHRSPEVPGIADVGGAWIAAQKARICPTITFIGAENEARS